MSSLISDLKSLVGEAAERGYQSGRNNEPYLPGTDDITERIMLRIGESMENMINLFGVEE